MWLCTKYGFYSIVQKKPGEYHIRARVKGDLENLKAISEIKRSIIITEDADYRYRLVVNEIEVITAMTVLAHTLDYPNFKSEIAKAEDQRDKLSAYHKIWELMMGFQKKFGKTQP